MKANTKQAAFRALYPPMENKGAWLKCPLPFRTTAYKGLVGPHETEFMALGIPGVLPQGGQGPEGSPTVTVGMRESAALAGIKAWQATGNEWSVKQAMRPFKKRKAPQGVTAAQETVETEW